MSPFLDEDWFARYEALDLPPVLTSLKGDPGKRARAKKAFLENAGSQPSIDYPALAHIDFASKRQACSDLLAAIQSSESNGAIVQAYTGALNRSVDTLHLLEATHDGRDDVFQDYTERLYGTPRKVTVERCLHHVHSMLDLAKAANRKRLTESIQYIDTWIHGFGAPKGDPIAPVYHPKETGAIDAHGIKARFVEALQDYGIENWTIRVDEDHPHGAIHVDHLERVVIVPSGRIVNQAHLDALAAHEIGVHVRRAINAQQTPLKLLTRGLSGYIRGDEGLSKLAERGLWPQSLNGTIEIYLMMASIYGFDGQKRNFRDLFTLSSHYFRVAGYNRRPSTSQVNDHAYNMRAMRLFRGTTGHTKGVCYTKDVAYLDGMLDIEDYLAGQPDERRRLLAGKYDPANPEHRDILDRLDI